MIESIHWIDADKQLPDDEITVMVYHPSLNEPVWFGFYLQTDWYTPDGLKLKPGSVTHWAEIPEGPTSSAPANPQPLSLEELKQTDAYKNADSNGYNALVWFKRGFKQAEKSYGIGKTK